MGGWYTAPEGGTRVTEDYVFLYSITLYAHWNMDLYVVPLVVSNPEYGSLSQDTIVNQPCGTLYSLDSNDLIIGNTRITPIPADAGEGYTYEFAGWYIGNQVVTEGTITNTMTFTARFVKYVTLTFMSMDQQVGSRNVIEGGMVGALPSVNEPGYNLIGWFDDQDQGVSGDTPIADLPSYTITAEWSIITYTIMYRDGSFVIPGLQPASYRVTNDTVVLPSGEPKPGYLFKGWYDNNSLSGSAIEQFDGLDCEDKIFYAKYEENTNWVTLTFMSKGEEVGSSIVSDEEWVGTIPSVSEPGYNLIGWFDHSGQQIFYDTLVAELSSYTITAEWSTIEYNITYKDGGDTVTGLQPTCYYITSQSVVLPTDLEKNGFDFGGWYADPEFNGSAVTSIDVNDCEDKIFYARFVDYTYEAVYDWSADGKKCTVYLTCAAHPEANTTLQVDSSSEVLEEPDCTIGGITRYTISGTYVSLDYSSTMDIADMPALGHGYVAEVIGPTCTEGGHTIYTCSECGDTYEDDFTEPLGHDYRSEVIAPTCEEEGYTIHTCSRCGDTYWDSYVPPIGHDYSPTYSWADDGGSCIVTLVCSHDPNHTLSFSADVVSTAVSDPVFSAKGVTEYSVSGTYEGISCSDSIQLADVDYVPKTKDGVTLMEDSAVPGVPKDVTSLFETAKAAGGEIVLSVATEYGEIAVLFDQDAVKSIGGNQTAFKISLGYDPAYPDAQLVLEITLDGATFRNGKVTITLPFDIPIPEDKVAKLYYVNNNRWTDMHAVFADGFVTFETNHFSTYVVVFEDPIDVVGLLSVAAGVMLVITAVGAVSILLVRRRSLL